MKKLLVIAFTLAAFRAVAADITLQGTIGKYPVVMNISTDDDGNCKAKYFYLSSLHDIYLRGTGGKMTFTFSAPTYDDKGKSTGTESFSLIEDSKGNFSGAWKRGKGKVLPVSLHPATIISLNSTYERLDAIKEADNYDRLKAAEMKIIQDSIVQKGAYSVRFIHIAPTKTAFIQLENGPDTLMLRKINELLLDKLLKYALQNSSCYSFNYYFTGPVIKGRVFSTNIFSSIICDNSGHSMGDEPINLDLHTGKEIKLQDILYISEVAPPNGDDSSHIFFDYCEKVLGPKIMKLMQSLHPKEMKGVPAGDDSDCNYNDVDVWRYSNWFLTDTGVYLSPSFGWDMAGPCGDPEWSVIPYTEMKKYPTPHSGIKLEK